MNTLKIGNDSGPSQGQGTYNFDGGTLDVEHILLGDAGGIGTFNQAAGTSLNLTTLDLGNFGWGVDQGSYNLTGGNLSAYDEKVGIFERGIFTQSGGINTIANNLYIVSVEKSLLARSLTPTGRCRPLDPLPEPEIS